MTERETFRPRWKKNGLLHEHRPGYGATRLYPTNLGDHEIEAAYTYEKQSGRCNLVKYKLTCSRCDCRVSIESEHLSKEGDDVMYQLRGYMHGYFAANDCV